MPVTENDLLDNPKRVADEINRIEATPIPAPFVPTDNWQVIIDNQLGPQILSDNPEDDPIVRLGRWENWHTVRHVQPVPKNPGPDASFWFLFSFNDRLHTESAFSGMKVSDWENLPVSRIGDEIETGHYFRVFFEVWNGNRLRLDIGRSKDRSILLTSRQRILSGFYISVFYLDPA